MMFFFLFSSSSILSSAGFRRSVSDLLTIVDGELRREGERKECEEMCLEKESE